jgi:hypothetical protein
MKSLTAPLLAFALAALTAALGCPSNAPVAANKGCESSTDCDGARCVVVDHVGHCEGNNPPPAAGEGEGEGAPVTGEGEGEGAPVTGEGEGEGAPVTGEGEGEGAPVDNTLHFARGAFVGGERHLTSAHFTLDGAFSSTRRR